MYESFFGFQERPFNETGRLDYYFPGESIEQARTALVRAIDHAAGPGLVIGPAGTGKTLLCRLLAEQYRYAFDVVHLACNRLCTRRALLQNILFELKLAYRQREEGELRLSLIDHLGRAENQRQGMLLLVDEAHTLPLRLLDEVRMITNLVRDGQPRVRLVVVGGPSLEEKFAHPKLDSFNQRIATRCYLGALNREECRHYLRHRVTIAGGRPDRLFADEAYRSLYQATDGIPRLLNQISDQALSLTALRGSHQVSATLVEEAWADLQQLPTPWRASAAPVSSPVGIVEFGVLEEEPDDQAFEGHKIGPGTEKSELVEAGISESETLSVTRFDYGSTSDPSPLWGANDAPAAASSEFDLRDSIAPPTRRTQVSMLDGPFAGDFEDEEVIVCRYSSLEAASSRGRLKIVTATEDEFSAALAQLPQASTDVPEKSNVDAEVLLEAVPPAEPESPPTKLTLAADSPEPVWNDGMELEVYQACQYAAAIYDSALEPGGLDWTQWPGELAVAELGEAELAEETIEASPATIAATRLVEARPTTTEVEAPAIVLRTFPTDDRDIIIVEEEDEAQFGAPLLAVSERPQPQEYRQLFAKLRQT